MKVKGFKGVLQKLAVAPCDMQRVDAVGYDSRSTVLLMLVLLRSCLFTGRNELYTKEGLRH